MRRAGDGESTSIDSLIRIARREKSKIDELSCLEFETFRLRKIERRSAGTKGLVSLQSYLVRWHRVLKPSIVRDSEEIREAASSCGRRYTVLSLKMTGREGLLFQGQHLWIH